MNYLRFNAKHEQLSVSPGSLNLSAYINPEGQDKFTVKGAVANGHTGPLAMDIAFTSSYVIRQDNKGGGAGGVKHHFCKQDGTIVGTPGKDQDAPASITKAQFDAAGGHGHVFWRADYGIAGDYVFQGGGG